MDLLELIKYKNWADGIYIDYVNDLDDSRFEEVIPLLSKSVKQILYHIYQTYWGEIHLLTDRDWSTERSINEMSKSDIIQGIVAYNDKILDFVEHNDIDGLISWEEDGQKITTTPETIIFNFITHSAYHRGQLALLLRHHGLLEIKMTDYAPYKFSQ